MSKMRKQHSWKRLMREREKERDRYSFGYDVDEENVLERFNDEDRSEFEHLWGSGKRLSVN